MRLAPLRQAIQHSSSPFGLDNWNHKCQAVSKALYTSLQEAVNEEEEESDLYHIKRQKKIINLISKEQGILEKRTVKVENVTVEMDNGNLQIL